MRAHGNYNDLIMRVVNQIIKITDLNINSEEETDNRTNFEEF